MSRPRSALLSENPVDSVCGQSLFAKQEKFSALFSRNNFTRRGHSVEELQVEGNSFSIDCSQFLRVASFTYKQQQNVYEFFDFLILFFSRAILYDHCKIFYPISKNFCNFSLKLNIVNRRHVFLASEMEKHIK